MDAALVFLPSGIIFHLIRDIKVTKPVLAHGRRKHCDDGIASEPLAKRLQPGNGITGVIRFC